MPRFGDVFENEVIGEYAVVIVIVFTKPPRAVQRWPSGSSAGPGGCVPPGDG